MRCPTIVNKFVVAIIIVASNPAISQNVGINTLTPTHKFHVLGKIRFEYYSSKPKSLLISISPTGVLDTLLMPDDSTMVLRGDGKWVNATATDNWGSQTAITSFPLIGDGTSTQPIAITHGNNTNDIIVWNNSQWNVTGFSSTAINNNIYPLCNPASSNFIIKFDGFSLCNSLIYQSGSSIGLNTTTPSPSAILDVNSTSQGILLPRLSTAQRNTIFAPANGTIIFNTDNFCLEMFDAVSGTWLAISCPSTCSPCDTCPTPTINSIVGPSSVCAYDTVIYYVNASGADIYQWSTPFRWRIRSQRDSLFVNPEPQGGYLHVSACNECGCVEDSVNVSVYPVPSSPSISGPSSVCAGDLVQFIATPGYSWYIWELPPYWIVVSGANDDTITVQIPLLGGNSNLNELIKVRGCSPCCSEWSAPFNVIVKAECRFCRSWGVSGDTVDAVRGATKLPDGTIVVTGYTINPNDGTTDMVVARYSPDGNLMWHQIIDFGLDEVGYDVTLGFSNDLYAVGNGSANTVVARLDLSTGNIIWAHPFVNGPRCRSIAKAPSGNKLWLGGITPESGGDGFYAIFEMDTLGTALNIVNGAVSDATGTTSRTQKDMIIVSNNSTIGAIVVGGGQSITCLNVFQCGGNFVIHPKTGGNLDFWRFTGILDIDGITQDPTDGHFIVVGTTTDYKIWVAKIDSSYTPGGLGNLNILWQKVISTGTVHFGHDVTIVNNDIWVLGYDSLGGAQSDMLLVVFDSNGNFKWAKSYGDQGGGGEAGMAILPIPGSGAFLIGTKREPNLSDNIFIVRVNGNGDPTSGCSSCATNTSPSITNGGSSPEIRTKFLGGSGAINSPSSFTTRTGFQLHSSCP